MNTKPTLSKWSGIPQIERRAAATGIFLLLLLLALPAVVQAQFIYATNNGTITITGYTGPGGAVTIPDRIPDTTSGLPVTSIGDWAFFNCTNLTSVTIPNGVTGIGMDAFACTSLTGVTIANSVIDIGDAAFCFCPNLISVTIPSSVTSIGGYAFLLCSSLTSVVISNSATSIGIQAFYDCTSLASVTMGNSVTSIAAWAFGGCTNLANVTIPNTVISIGDSAFSGCTSLEAITVDTNNIAYSSADGVLFNKSQSTLVAYPGGKGSYRIPNSVTNIGDYAFYSCASLSSITIPNSVTSIGDWAFYDCSSLTGVYFQGNAPSLGGSSVFVGANNATVYYLPGTSGWGSTFGGVPAAMLNSPDPAGSMQVTISPAMVVAAGAQWYVDGGIPQPSGATVLGLSVGNHTVSFSTVGGWLTPSNQTVSVSANATATATGTYVANAPQSPFTYTFTNGTLTITGYTGPGGAVTIPDTILGVLVTSIADWAFYNGGHPQPYTLTSVTIPNSVTSIGQYAFAWTGLSSATLGNGLTSIGEGAFADCGLITITIPSSVASLGDGAFAYCGNLTGAYFQGNAPSLGGPSVFAGDGNIVYYLSGTTGWGPTFGGRSTAPWTIPQVSWIYTTNNGTITITSYTGQGGAVTIPDTINGLPVTCIGNGAFASCTSLASVMIPNSVTTIGDYAFDQCTSLTNATIGSSVTSIGDEAFYYCTSLASISIPNSVTSIGDYAFCLCYSLNSVTIGTNVISIGDEAFYYCINLASVTIPNSVTSIGYEAFYYCRNLPSVTIPNSVTSIGEIAFEACGSLTNVMIGNSVTSIGDGAFLGCTSLSAITVDALNSAYSSVDGTLFDKSQATLIQCPGGKAGSYTIPNSVISVGTRAFWLCTNLISATIGTSVTSIGEYAFGACFSLTGVYFEGNAPSLGGSSVFDNDSNATVYYLPGTTGWGTTFGGRPTALWPPATIQTAPQTQTAEATSAVSLHVEANSPLPLLYFWYLNATNLLSSGTTWQLDLPNMQLAQSGAYTVVVSNVLGAVTSAPAMLNVITPVERRPVPGVKLTGEAGSVLNVDYADSLSTAPNWTALGSVSLTSTSQYYFDLAMPLPPQRYFRAWQTGTSGVIPSLEAHLVPAITLTGNMGASVRVDYINRFGPTDAWVTLNTVTLTNTSQLYFDVSAPGQPQRLYRLVPLP